MMDSQSVDDIQSFSFGCCITIMMDANVLRSLQRNKLA